MPTSRNGAPTPAPGPDWLAPYDYDLPPERIARRPVEPRDTSRLLVLDRATGARSQSLFRSLPRWLQPGDLLVLNDTRVLRARIFTRLERTGRPIEVLVSHPEGEGWLALLGPGRRLKPGDRLIPWSGTGRAAEVGDDSGRDAGASGSVIVLLEPREQGLWRLRAEGESVETLMARHGHVPLPPYIDRADLPADRNWYQTVYARNDGAVAAPTAGLHFTPTLLARLEQAGIAVARVTLHVGPGTFLPVRAERAADHAVLPERFEIPAEAAEAMSRARRAGGRVVAVGTTVARALETAVGASREGPVSPEPIDLRARAGWTDLTITPGHRFRAVDALVTNFHLPRSSLLLLVAAFAGRERILEAYAEARDAGFRFYSYGDAMLIL